MASPPCTTIVSGGLSEDVTKALAALAREHRLTMNTIVQGAWAILLSRYSGDRQVLYGATNSGRDAPIAGVETITGCFVNTTPLRVDVDGSAERVRRRERPNESS